MTSAVPFGRIWPSPADASPSVGALERLRRKRLASRLEPCGTARMFRMSRLDGIVGAPRGPGGSPRCWRVSGGCPLDLAGDDTVAGRVRRHRVADPGELVQVRGEAFAVGARLATPERG
jgi:hypothetical protein